jgi:DNA-binding HxlR family transcriptional regulator
MKDGYKQFCPVAKASEIFATRWTPLILRELMGGCRTFNDIHRGVPLMSRALLAERLRQLEHDGVVERHSKGNSRHVEYWLTPAGDAFRPAIDGLARWGAFYARDRIQRDEMDPGLFMWALRKRLDTRAIGRHRLVMRFEFSGVITSRTKLRLMWLVIRDEQADVCLKDPGYPVDVTLRGDIAAFVGVLLGHVSWKDQADRTIAVEADDISPRDVGTWLGL